MARPGLNRRKHLYSQCFRSAPGRPVARFPMLPTMVCVGSTWWVRRDNLLRMALRATSSVGRSIAPSTAGPRRHPCPSLGPAHGHHPDDHRAMAATPGLAWRPRAARVYRSSVSVNRTRYDHSYLPFALRPGIRALGRVPLISPTDRPTQVPVPADLPAGAKKHIMSSPAPSERACEWQEGSRRNWT